MSTVRSFSTLPGLQIRQPVRRKCFISYYHGDKTWARYFAYQFGGTNGTIIPRVLGLEDNAIQSSKPDYVIDTIRAEYISGSSVSIVLIGTCTHSRRFVDWEIKRGLLNGNGLLGIILPPKIREYLPERFAVNWRQDDMGYAALRLYPKSAVELRSWIDDAVWRSRSRQNQLRNAQDAWTYNHRCATCGVTHYAQ